MKLYSSLGTLLVTILLLLTAISHSDSPPANTIPIISMKTGQGETSLDITLDVICNLLWHNFDGIWVEGWINSTGYQHNPAILSDSVGAFVVLAPSWLQALNNIPDERWARYTPAGLQTSSAFMHPDSIFSSIASTAYATDMIANITDRCSLLAGDASNFECIWYYDIFNEGPAWQLNRITDPDLNVVLSAKGDTLTDCRGLPGEQIDVIARFYNMGTGSLDSVRVFLYNETTDEVLDRSYISFDGLSTASCWTTDRDDAIFSWTPNSSYLGANVLSVYTEEINEPDTTDNSATLVYIVDPRDYATEILDDPWDMSEATTSIPDWYTHDIVSLTGCWNGSAYTDSISGMFEGALTNPTYSNGVYLNTGSGSSDYIDADRYYNLSLAGMSATRTLITVHWLDSHDDTGYITLIGASDTLRAVAADLGPWNLSELSGSWTGDMKKLWLEFNGAGNLSTDIRIGWVKLTE